MMSTAPERISVCDVERIFTAFWLGDHEVFQINTDDPRIARVKRMLDINEHCVAAFFCACAMQLRQKVVLPELSGP